jgi:hypothetical protein
MTLKPSRLALLLMFALLLPGGAGAAEIATNGVGGGAWSDPATWRAKKTPGATDDVVIQKNDVVVFDRADDGKPTCRKLQIDPRGGLTFKTGAGKLVLAISDGIETFGAIRLDGTKFATDDFELRLLGDAPAKRLIKLGKGGALLLYGGPDLPGGRRNVALVSVTAKEPMLGTVECAGAGTIDWQRAAVKDVKLTATSIDNTGAKPNERLKLADNLFTGLGRIHLQGCDTPEIVRNRFGNLAGTIINEPAIHLHTCPLAEIKDNVIRGGFAIGIGTYIATDNVLIGNTIEKCTIGINGGYGVPNVMIKQATIKGCDAGIKLEGATGVLEDVTIEGGTAAFYQSNSRLQLTGFRVKQLAKKGVAVELETGTLSLLNCDLRPDDLKIAPQKPDPAKPPVDPVTCLQYLVVAVKGAPAGALVEVRTSLPALAAGAADANVRNSPAALNGGHTPLASALTPLLVKSWHYNPLGKPMPAPEYSLKVLGVAAKGAATRPILATQTFRPQPNAYRADPNDKTPTVEVLIK